MKEKFEATFDVFHVDSNNGLSLVGGDLLPLPPKELALLCSLIRYAGQLVTKDTIVSEVWNGSDVSDASIMRCVSSLKKHLSQVTMRDEDFIRSEYGRGYRFVGEVTSSRSVITDDAFFAVIDASPDFIALKDGEGRWLAVNQAGLSMYELIGLDWQGKTDCEIAEMSPKFTDNLAACTLTDEQAWTGAKTMNFVERMYVNEVVRVFYVAKSPLFNADGSRKMLVVFGREVTELLRLERELQI